MRQTRISIGIALAAAFVLALQTALAVASVPVQRDIFGNAICADGSGGQMPGGSHDGGHLPDCCLSSCVNAAPIAADVPNLPGWPAVPTACEPVVHEISQDAPWKPRRTPANPRAPPAA